jgi:hypothetical protein
VWTVRRGCQAALSSSQLDEEIESWKGFPWALRKEDREQWDAMIKQIREEFGEAIELSGRNLTTDPLFMALLLAQQRTIKQLKAELIAHGVEVSDQEATTMTTLDE